MTATLMLPSSSGPPARRDVADSSTGAAPRNVEDPLEDGRDVVVREPDRYVVSFPPVLDGE